MSLSEDFVSQACDAFRKTIEQASGVPSKEGMEREFRRALARHLFDDLLGWEGHSKVAEIIDIAFFDDENFPIIVVETKWGVELTPETKEKLRKRIEELGSVKYGILANEREFIVYSFRDFELKDVAKVNIATAAGVAKGEYGLSDVEMKNLRRLEELKRERLVWAEAPQYFPKTYKQVSVAKAEGIKLLTDNLKAIIKDLTAVLTDFFDHYWRRTEYSGKFLRNTFTDWLKISMRGEFRESDEKQQQAITEIFCRETAYVLLGKILFIRICEDKDILATRLSGAGLADFLEFYEKRKRENVYLLAFDESREEIKKNYRHFHELGFFDWWIIEEMMKGALLNDNRKIQDVLEKNLDYSIKKALRRLNRFDFSQVNRDILGDVYQGYLPSDERKRLGEFYTPKEVVDYILDSVDYKPASEIRGKKILDPACGSGSFIVEATQRLIERYKRSGLNLRNPDDARQIIEGCVNSIYGLDIHPFASFIAEMNLMFQLLDLYDTVRQKDRYYELPRLNIYRTDSLVLSREVSIEIQEFAENLRRKMLVAETKGANRIKEMMFHFIVGNPPYVRIEKIPEEKRQYYKEKYSGAEGRFDLYMLFIERGLKWLEKHGKLAFIASNRFMKTDTGRKLREFITQNFKIMQVIDFGDISLFEAATNYPCILVFQNEKVVDNEVWYVRVRKSERDIMIRLKNSLAKEVSNEHLQASLVEQKLLTDDVWRPLSKQINSLFKKLDSASTVRLKDISIWNLNGIFTGLNSVFIIRDDVIDKYQIEPEVAKRLLVGEDVRKWKISWSGNYILYTKDIDLEKTKNTYRYLKEHQERLSKRVSIRGTGIKWHELSRPRDPSAFECKKIVTPRIATGNNFALDEKGEFYCGDTTYVIVPNDSVDILYLLGLLNSKVLDFYLKQVSPFFMDKYFVYNASYTERFPIKLPETLEEKETAELVIQSVEQILELSRQLQSIEKRITQFPSAYFDNNWSFDKLMNLVKVQNLSRATYTISQKQLRTDYKQQDLHGVETFRIILAPNEFLEFHSEEIASYVLEILKTMSIITKRELLELKIPVGEQLRSLIIRYHRDKQEMTNRETLVRGLEERIDEFVYKLYDISYTEGRIIEDYLTKF